jgi:hypothetical protein
MGDVDVVSASARYVQKQAGRRSVNVQRNGEFPTERNDLKASAAGPIPASVMLSAMTGENP